MGGIEQLAISHGRLAIDWRFDIGDKLLDAWVLKLVQDDTVGGRSVTEDAYGIIPVMNNIAARSSAFVVRRAWVLNQVQDDMSGGQA